VKYLEILNLITPIILVLLTVIIIINLNFFILKKLGFLNYPYNGLEWSQVIWSGAYLFSQMIINLSLVYPTIQTFRYFNSNKITFFDLIKSILPYFSTFILTTFVISVLFFFTSQLILLLIPGERKSAEEIKNGNIPISILTSFIMIGISIFFYLFSMMFLENQIPFSITIN
jgi:hypothetical protein